jgi:hypothetical protein
LTPIVPIFDFDGRGSYGALFETGIFGALKFCNAQIKPTDFQINSSDAPCCRYLSQ